MIKCISLGKTPKRISFEKAIETKQLVWIDIINPTEEEINFLYSKLNLSKKDIKDSLDLNEIPRVERNEKYAFIIFKTPLKGDSNPKITTLGIFILGNKLITIHKHNIHAINEIYNHFSFSSDIGELFSLLLEKILSDYMHTITSIDKEIEQFEEKIFSQATKNTAMKIFSLKKELIYFQQSLISNREVISTIKSTNPLALTRSELKKFDDLYDDCTQLIEMSNTHKEILSSALEIHTSAVSNQLNQIIKKMTVIGSLVLIPTLIASIYGMNFGQPLRPDVSPLNMPELNWYFGYPFALGLMGLSVVLMWIYFKKKKWI